MYNIIAKIKMAFIYLFNWLFRRKEFTYEIFQIGNSDVQAIFKLKYPDATFSACDGEYNFTTLAGWKQIIAEMVKDNSPYKKNFHDCDDFADYFKGHISNDYDINGCFRVSGQSESGASHAFNIILYQEGSDVMTCIVEPQDGTLFKEYKVSIIRG